MGKRKKHERVSISHLRYLEAVRKIIESGRADNEQDFIKQIGWDETVISRMKSEQNRRNLTLPQLEATIKIYDLNANYFFRDHAKLFLSNEQPAPPSPVFNADGGSVKYTAGDHIVNINKGDYYEKYAEQVINEAPPELQTKLETLVHLTKGIKKMNFDFEQENSSLKTRIDELQSEVNASKKEELAAKDELLDLYREMKHTKKKN